MIKSGFFNSIDGDRRYRSEDFADHFAAFLSNGVFEGEADYLQVLPHSGLTVKVRPGRAWINGYGMHSTAEEPLVLAAAHASLGRIDRVCARLNLGDRRMELVVLTGTPASEPVAPAISRTAGLYDLCLAQISVPAGLTTVTAYYITDTRSDTELCGGVIVKTANALTLEGKADKRQAFDYGDIKLTARATAPAYWLLCQGQAISRTTYAALFDVIGTTYGAGDGSTTFNLPDMRGRVPVGMDTTQTEFNGLGKKGGEKKHALTASEGPEHTHIGTLATYSHSTHVPYGENVAGTGSQSEPEYSRFTTASSGSGTPHNNLQPYITLNYIIYTGVA